MYAKKYLHMHNTIYFKTTFLRHISLIGGGLKKSPSFVIKINYISRLKY